MIELKNVTKKFGRFTAVNDISMNIEAGEVLGFLGPNGAGKTTTMRMISGFLRPTSGTIRVCGYDTAENLVKVKQNIGYMPEGAQSFGDMNVSSFLNFIAKARDLTISEREKAIEKVVEDVSIGNVLYQSIDTLSKGFKRRVGLAGALLHNPRVLILDEPTEGLDVNQKREVRALIRRICKNKAIIISTHVLEEVEAICSRCVLIDSGKLVLDATPQEMLSMSETHKKLFFIVPKFQEQKAKVIFEEYPMIESIESTIMPGDEQVMFTLISVNGKIIAPDLVELLHRQDVQINDMFMEKGRLEEVFYAFTSPEHEVKSE